MSTRFSDTIGGGSGPNPTDAFKIAITAPDTNALPTDSSTFALAITEPDTSSLPTETTMLSINGLGDSNNIPTEVRTVVVRSWASGCTSNDANQSGVANVNGANDGVFCTIKTNNAVGDLTNPVFVTTGSMNFPGGTVTSAVLRVWFKIPAGTTGTDTLSILLTSSGGYSATAFTHTSAGAVDHSSGDFTFDISTLTNTQLTNLVVKFNYLAVVVATPDQSLQVDAVAIDVTETI